VPIRGVERKSEARPAPGATKSKKKPDSKENLASEEGDEKPLALASA